VAAETPAHLETVEMWKHEIEDDEIRRPRGDGRECVAPVRHMCRREAGLVEIPLDQMGDIRIILDDQD
jgi:hypothetical protein